MFVFIFARKSLSNNGNVVHQNCKYYQLGIGISSSNEYSLRLINHNYSQNLYVRLHKFEWKSFWWSLFCTFSFDTLFGKVQSCHSIKSCRREFYDGLIRICSLTTSWLKLQSGSIKSFVNGTRKRIKRFNEVCFRFFGKWVHKYYYRLNCYYLRKSYSIEQFLSIIPQ